MTTAPELIVSTPRGAPYYVIGAFTEPHVRVRELMAEPQLRSLAWRIVLFSAVVGAVAGLVLIELVRDDKSATTFLPVEYAFGDMLLRGAVGLLAFVVSFILTILLWSYLFRYRDQKDGVWAASAMATCPSMILNPALSAGLFVAGDGSFVSLAIVSAYAFVISLILAIYYRATLVISYARAVCLQLLSSLIFFVGLIVLVLVGALLFFLLFGSVTP